MIRQKIGCGNTGNLFWRQGATIIESLNSVTTHFPKSLDDKVAQILRQLECGDLVLVFDEAMEAVNIMLKRDLPPELLE